MFIARSKSLIAACTRLNGNIALVHPVTVSTTLSPRFGITPLSFTIQRRLLSTNNSPLCANIKLDYFNIRGLAEPIRMVLHYGGVKFEDVRSPLPGWPPKMSESDKDKYRWGQVPCAVIDGKELYQSATITRYFAGQCGLIPADPYLAALCDEYVDVQRDIMIAWAPAAFAPTAAKKRLLCDDIYRLTKPRFLDVFEKIIKGSSSGKHLVGDKMTWADIHMAYAFDHVEKLIEFDVIKDHPSMKKVCETVWNVPSLKKWKETRPETPA
ncbi:unnamed protein product [Orchesella dallaii]|uniref:glutathione transferase n=1 Tax=Orchesella dallaii TaxID=48710 RepID=A0ABP1QUX7_9HEXA